MRPVFPLVALICSSSGSDFSRRMEDSAPVRRFLQEVGDEIASELPAGLSTGLKLMVSESLQSSDEILNAKDLTRFAQALHVLNADEDKTDGDPSIRLIEALLPVHKLDLEAISTHPRVSRLVGLARRLGMSPADFTFACQKFLSLSAVEFENQMHAIEEMVQGAASRGPLCSLETLSSLGLVNASLLRNLEISGEKLRSSAKDVNESEVIQRLEVLDELKKRLIEIISSSLVEAGEVRFLLLPKILAIIETLFHSSSVNEKVISLFIGACLRILNAPEGSYSRVALSKFIDWTVYRDAANHRAPLDFFISLDATIVLDAEFIFETEFGIRLLSSQEDLFRSKFSVRKLKAIRMMVKAFASMVDGVVEWALTDSSQILGASAKQLFKAWSIVKNVLKARRLGLYSSVSASELVNKFLDPFSTNMVEVLDAGSESHTFAFLPAGSFLKRIGHVVSKQLQPAGLSDLLAKTVEDSLNSVGLAERDFDQFAQALQAFAFFESVDEFSRQRQLIKALLAVPQVNLDAMSEKMAPFSQFARQVGLSSTDFSFAWNRLSQLEGDAIAFRIESIKKLFDRVKSGQAPLMGLEALYSFELVDFSLARRFNSISKSTHVAPNDANGGEGLESLKTWLASPESKEQLNPRWNQRLRSALDQLANAFELLNPLRDLDVPQLGKLFTFLNLLATVSVMGIRRGGVSLESVVERLHNDLPVFIRELSELRSDFAELKNELSSKITSHVVGYPRIVIVPKLLHVINIACRVGASPRILSAFVDMFVDILNPSNSGTITNLVPISEFLDSLIFVDGAGAAREPSRTLYAMFRAKNPIDLVNTAFLFSKYFEIPLLRKCPDLAPSDWSDRKKSLIRKILKSFTFFDGPSQFELVDKERLIRASEGHLEMAFRVLLKFMKYRPHWSGPHAVWVDVPLVNSAEWLNDFLSGSPTRWALALLELEPTEFPTDIIELLVKINFTNLKYGEKLTDPFHNTLSKLLRVPQDLMQTLYNYPHLMNPEISVPLKLFASLLFDLADAVYATNDAGVHHYYNCLHIWYNRFDLFRSSLSSLENVELEASIHISEIQQTLNTLF